MSDSHTLLEFDESYFSYDELFFSKTDFKGFIEYGNSVFQRVSDYSWNELKGSPHNIIRHEDMPKGVFFLFWKYLKENKPICAFVKNKSKLGKYYWVLAIAMPVNNGFISVRIKPSGKIFEIAKGIYKEVLNNEKNNSVKPIDSAQFLMTKINELGYANYDLFMSEVLADQIKLRCEKTQTLPHVSLQLISDIKNQGTKVVTITQKILSTFAASRMVPLNLEIFSNNKGSQGAQVAVVASHYQKDSVVISNEIKKFEKISGEVIAQITTSQFFVSVAALLSECLESLVSASEENTHVNQQTNEIEILSSQYMSIAFSNVKSIDILVKEFIKTCDLLNQLGLGLELIRLKGKIELTQISNTSEALDMLEKLKLFQVALKHGLSEIRSSNNLIGRSAQEILKLLN